MRLREGKITNLPLLIITILTVLFVYLELNSTTKVQAPYFKEKFLAAELTRQCFEIIRNGMNRMDIPIDRINDPNGTGLIGMQYSPITTERGDLNAKLTSTNPNFAALIMQLLRDAGIKNNDLIAVSFSGSFPALNIAVLGTLKTLQLRPIIITSVGASMWGANYPQFTYLDMEKELRDAGLIDYQSIAASIGGEDDIGRGLSPEGRDMIIAAIQRNNIPMLNVEGLDASIQKRLAIYQKDNKPKAFINIGGGSAASGGLEIPSGLIKPGAVKYGNNLIAEFSKANVPVINLVDIDRLAEKYNLPLAPMPLPNIGDGILYYETKYSVGQAILYSSILIIILFFVLRFDTEYYLKLGFREILNIKGGRS